MISDFYLSKKWGLELYFCQTTKYVDLCNLQFTHSRAKFLPFYHYLYKLNPWKIVRMKRIIQIHPLLFLKTIYWSKYAAGKINLNFFYEIWFGNWLLDYMKKKTYGRFENGSFLVENLSTHMFSRHSSFVTPLKNIWVFNIGILM